ncbi:MAG: helix-turn-helix domain-containing protein [Steroidobacteraceae bacterium]
MTSDELKAALVEIGISQTDFARLVDVTARAVALWMADERAIPGPAAAYVRVLRLMPPSFRQVELSRLKLRGTGMRDGMFGITFQGQQSAGMGVLILDAGRVYGTDTQGVRYDGEYVFDENTGTADVKVKVTFPPNVVAVFGISNPYEWAFDVTTSFNPKVNSGPLPLKTSIGRPLNAQYVFLRPLPDAA